MSNSNVYVTRPALPSLSEYIPYLEEIWSSGVVTNGGKFHTSLEKELAEFLGVKYVSLFANGTIALLTALQALKIGGEVITTPYSFVATSHSLLWNNLRPVFVDVDEHTFNINPELIEAAISQDTSAILAVHCYGIPCEVEKIKEIADDFGLKVVYDAAHAFGVSDCQFNSLLNHGDFSVLSFHATKVFNTFEGGAIISHDRQTKERIDRLKNFGFKDEVTIVATGINGKMSELNAAMGLLQLKHVNGYIERRKLVHDIYQKKLSHLEGVILPKMGNNSNYSYFPIRILKSGRANRDKVYEHLKSCNIYARRYFYPLITDFPAYRNFVRKNDIPCATRLSEEVLCLPIYPDLSAAQQECVINAIKEVVL